VKNLGEKFGGKIEPEQVATKFVDVKAKYLFCFHILLILIGLVSFLRVW